MREDAALIERAVNGDEDALRLLYERHVDFVFTRARDALGRRPEALDIVQETFLRAVRQPERPAEPDSFRILLARIADQEIARAAARRSPPVAKATPGPPRLSEPERDLVFGWIRRRWATDPWRGLWKWVVAAAAILVLIALWQLHRTVGAPVP